MDKLGAQLTTLSKKDASDLDVKGGVMVKAVTENGLMDRSRIQAGFIILRANGQEVKSVEEFQKVLEKASGTIKLEGVFAGYEGVYTYPLRISSGN
jgi:S1-C subfamily serine protease